MLTDDLSDFAPEEYERRITGLKEQMAENGMDAVLITTDANHRYFTGHASHRWTHKYTAIFALLPLEKEPVLIVPPIEAGMCAEDSWIETIRTFPAVHTLQGVHAITEAVKALGLEKARIGAELGGVLWMRMPFQDFGRLQQDLPRAEFIDASPLFWKLRARKSPAEVALIRKAVSITNGAYQALFKAVRPGITEREVHRLLAVEHLNRGGELPGSITLATHIPGNIRASNRSLRRPTDRTLTRGELIAHDAGGVYRGYWSDYTRMFALAQASRAHKKAYRAVYDCLQAAIAAIKPGVPIADLVHASNATMKTSGYPDHAGRVTGIGHAIGLDIIEPPFIAFEDASRLEEGMVLTVEPSLYTDDAYFMLEEDVLVTDRGYEILSTPASEELPVL